MSFFLQVYTKDPIKVRYQGRKHIKLYTRKHIHLVWTPQIGNTSGLEEVIKNIFRVTYIYKFSIHSFIRVNNHSLTWVLSSVGLVRLGRVLECEINAVGVGSVEMPEKQHSFSECDHNQSLFNVWKGRWGLFARCSNRMTAKQINN